MHKGLSVCGTPAVPRPSFCPSFLIPGPVKGPFVRRRRWLAPDTGSHAAFFALEAARARRSCSRACILLPGLAPLGGEGHPCPQPVTGPWCSGTRPMARSCSGQPGCLPAPQPALAGRRGHRCRGLLTKDAPWSSCPTTVPSHLRLHRRWEPPASLPSIPEGLTLISGDKPATFLAPPSPSLHPSCSSSCFPPAAIPQLKITRNLQPSTLNSAQRGSPRFVLCQQSQGSARAFLASAARASGCCEPGT